MDCKNIGECMTSIESHGSKSTSCENRDCLKQCDDRTHIVVQENKKRYELLNSGRRVAVFQVDGGMIASKDTIKCDNMLLELENHIAVLVELKGTDLRHALEQIDSTRKRLEKELIKYVLYGRIVTSNRTNVPNIRTCPQYIALQKAFMQKKGNLKIKADILQERVEELG